MTCGIYAYQDNQKNRIIYVGASTDCEKRHKSHYSPSNMKSQAINYILQNDIDNRYSFILLLECKRKDLFDKEREFIQLINPEYNNVSITDICEKYENANSSFTSTGFYHVSMNGASYCYRKTINNVFYQFYNVSIRDLEYVVKKNNLLWFITDFDKAERTLFISDNKKNNTLYYNVRKHKTKTRQGYEYVYKKDNIILKSMYIEELEYKVKSHGLEWRSFK